MEKFSGIDFKGQINNISCIPKKKNQHQKRNKLISNFFSAVRLKYKDDFRVSCKII
jgi:hypothetical protein